MHHYKSLCASVMICVVAVWVVVPVPTGLDTGWPRAWVTADPGAPFPSAVMGSFCSHTLKDSI